MAFSFPTVLILTPKGRILIAVLVKGVPLNDRCMNIWFELPIKAVLSVT